MARTYRRDSSGRFAGGVSAAPRKMRTALARTVAPVGTVAKRKGSRAANRDFRDGLKPGEKVKEQIGATSPWILRDRPRRLPGGPKAPSRLQKGLDDVIRKAPGAVMTRRSRRRPRPLTGNPEP